jgi:hypothetical protein
VPGSSWYSANPICAKDAAFVGHRAGKRLSLLAWAALLACGPRPGAENASDLQRASLGEPATAALVVGCWLLEWDLALSATGQAAAEVPDSVRLREEVVFATRERLVIPATHPNGRGATGTGEMPWEARYVLNRWWIEDDALRIRFSDGEREAWDVMLSIDRGDLTGSARHRADPEPPQESTQAGIRAVRITCNF